MSKENQPITKKHLKLFDNAKKDVLSSNSIDNLLDGKMNITTDIDFSTPTKAEYIQLRKHVSYSEIATWMDCSFKHKLKYLDEVKTENDGPSEHTEFGQVIHDALEQYLATKVMPPIEQVKAQLTEMFAKLPNASELKQSEWHDTIEPILSEVPAFMEETFGDWKFVAAELPLMESLDNHNHMFKGFIDGVIEGVNKKGDRVVWIIDWKGQRLSAPILTPNGWVTMGSLKIGDIITGSDGKSTTVTGIYPLGEREVYRLTMRDGSTVECTDDHLWKVYSAGGEQSKVLMTKDLINNKKYKYLPVVSEPVVYNKQFSPKIHPYVLGLMLGDGSIPENHSCTFTTIDDFLIEKLKELAPSDWEIKKCAGAANKTPSYRLNGARKDFKVLGLLGHRSWEKFIPEEYKFGTSEQRQQLLQGILDTDGWVQKGIAKFSTTSEQLAKDVKDIVGSLGGVAFMSSRKKKRNESEKIEYIVTVCLPKGMYPFALERKLEKLNKNPSHKLWRTITNIEIVGKDEMQCIKVAAQDQLYVTSDFIVTHNTCSYFWPVAKRIDPKKTMQLAFYKHFYARKHNLTLKDVKCGFILLRRSKKKGNCELVTVSVGDKAVEKAMGTIDTMLGYIQKRMFPKNRESCKYCPYAGTEHCP